MIKEAEDKMKTNSSQVVSTSPEAMVIQLSLCLILLTTCLIGNGAICFLIMRFRTLKTVPNILLANLAAADFFTTLVTLPPFVVYHVFNDDLFNSSAGAWWITFLAFFFTLLNLNSMFILVVDRYLAIVYAIRYVWKSSSKALVAVSVAWVISLISSLVIAAPMYNIELGRKSVLYYKSVYAKRTNYRPSIVPIIAILVISIAIVTICTMREMWKSRRLRVSDVAVTLRKNSKREETASRSASTILMILLSFALSELLGFCLIILSTDVVSDEQSQWFFFLGTFLFFFSSSINAFIYSYRSSRFRLALKEILRSSIYKRGIVFPSNQNSSEVQKGCVFYIKGTFGKVQIQNKH